MPVDAKPAEQTHLGPKELIGVASELLCRVVKGTRLGIKYPLRKYNIIDSSSVTEYELLSLEIYVLLKAPPVTF